MADKNKHDNSLLDGMLTGREHFINPYTDFGFKKLFRQAEIAQFNEEERRQYEASLKEYGTIPVHWTQHQIIGQKRLPVE